jgi:hypothetical protein
MKKVQVCRVFVGAQGACFEQRKWRNRTSKDRSYHVLSSYHLPGWLLCEMSDRACWLTNAMPSSSGFKNGYGGGGFAEDELERRM